jgi:tetratricopeptide (TPR) repeat protein
VSKATSRPAALLSIWLLLWLPSMATAQNLDAAEVAALRIQADERYAGGDLEGATQLYLQIARSAAASDTRVQALITAGWLQHLQQRELAALDSLTQALSLDPAVAFDVSHYDRDFELLYRRALEEVARNRQRQAAQKVQEALVATEAGRDSEARLRLEEALDLTPSNALAIYNLALLDLRQGEEDRAMTGFERSASLTFGDSSPSSSALRAKALTSIGVIFFNRGDWQDAEEAFLQATQASPGEVLAWKNLGLSRLEQAEYPAAVQALQAAEELDPDDPELARQLAEALTGSARLPEAVELLNRSLERHPREASLWLSLGEVDLLLGSVEPAALALERAIESDPVNSEGVAAVAALQLASIRYRAGDYEAAAASARRSLQWDADSAEAWHILGLAQQADGDLDGAVTSLERSTTLEPARSELFLDLGHALVATRSWQAAEGALTTALALDPESEVVRRSLESVRARLTTERAIVAGSQAAPRTRTKPIPPKKIGLRFVELNYEKLNLRGALVDSVNKKSPAALAGLRKGDLILWVGDYGLLSDKDFFEFLKRSPPGESLDLKYLRDGKVYEASLQLR